MIRNVFCMFLMLMGAGALLACRPSAREYTVHGSEGGIAFKVTLPEGFDTVRCGGFAIRHLLLSGFVIRFDFIIKILFNNGNVQQTFLPSIVYR